MEAGSSRREGTDVVLDDTEDLALDARTKEFTNEG
jgi:hypothetical protein